MLNTNHLSFIYSFLLSLAFLLLMHAARHTFATTVTLSNNISLEVVSKMMGHTNTRMTTHYAKLIDRCIGEQMDRIIDNYTVSEEY